MESERLSQFAGVGDPELLNLMTLRDESAVSAWEELILRHLSYLQYVCRNSFAGSIGEHKIDDLVQDTFIKAYERANTFECRQDLDNDAGRRIVRAWLGKICERLVLDRFRGQPVVEFVDDAVLNEHIAAAIDGNDAADENSVGFTRLNLIENAVESLTEQEQTVLRTTMFWHKPGAGAQRVPNAVMTELASSLGTNPTNIRKIRERAMTKVRDFVTSHELSGGI